jgi:YHS domain-containing protein
MKSTHAMLTLALLFGGATTMLIAADKVPTTAPSTQPADKGGSGDKDKDKGKDDKPVNKFCAVQQENPIDAKGGTYLYKGKTIGFCCPDCIDDFKKDPEKYMATLK